MGLPLSDEQWKPIDEWIFRGWTINAVKAIREAAGVGIREAVDLVEDRRSKLRENKPGEFIIDEGFDGYRTGYFST